MTASHQRIALLVPLKSFDGAKKRLGEAVSAEVRQDLMRSLASGVLAAGRDFERWVVCDDPDVATFALRHGAQVIWRSGGLNAAVQQAFDDLARTGLDRVVVAHGDLGSPDTLASEFFEPPSHSALAVIIATDRHGDGTNVISVPTSLGFRFDYGPGSLHRHVEEATRCGASARILTSTQLGLDVDTPADLALYRGLQ